MKVSKKTDNKSLAINLEDAISLLTQQDVDDLIKHIEQINNNTPEQNKVLLDREGSQDVE